VAGDVIWKVSTHHHCLVLDADVIFALSSLPIRVDITAAFHCFRSLHVHSDGDSRLDMDDVSFGWDLKDVEA
jgi:hypothetical protein